MLSKIYSSGVIGIEGYEVTVECSAWDRVPRFELVGLPDAAVKEAKGRVQSACENSGYVFPPLDIMINLAPADVKKEGTAHDLAILVAILQSDGVISRDIDFSDIVICQLIFFKIAADQSKHLNKKYFDHSISSLYWDGDPSPTFSACIIAQDAAGVTPRPTLSVRKPSHASPRRLLPGEAVTAGG